MYVFVCQRPVDFLFFPFQKKRKEQKTFFFFLLKREPRKKAVSLKINNVMEEERLSHMDGMHTLHFDQADKSWQSVCCKREPSFSFRFQPDPATAVYMEVRTIHSAFFKTIWTNQVAGFFFLLSCFLKKCAKIKKKKGSYLLYVRKVSFLGLYYCTVGTNSIHTEIHKMLFIEICFYF